MKKVLAGFLLACIVSIFGCGGGGGETTSPRATAATAVSFLAWTGSADPSSEFQLVRVNGQTGQVTNIGGGNDFFPALVYGPDGTLYGVGSDLAVINPATGSTNKVGDFTFGGSQVLMASAAVSPNGELYVVENASPHRVFSVDLANAALTLVGTPSGLIRAISFSPDGIMYAAFADLYLLSPTDASTVRTIGRVSRYPNNVLSGVYISSLASGEDGILYGIDIYPSTVLYKVDVSTAVASPVTLLGSGNMVSIVAERSVAVKSKRVSQQLSATSHKSRAELLAMESQLKSSASNR